MASLCTFKRYDAPNGLPGWRVSCGSAVVGTIFNPGASETNGATWYGVTPDSARFDGPSRDKVAAKMTAHKR